MCGFWMYSVNLEVVIRKGELGFPFKLIIVLNTKSLVVCKSLNGQMVQWIIDVANKHWRIQDFS